MTLVFKKINFTNLASALSAMSSIAPKEVCVGNYREGAAILEFELGDVTLTHFANTKNLMIQF